jgi:translocation and assembly module TamB
LKYLRFLAWSKWLRHLFVTFHFLLLSTLLSLSALVYVVFRTDSLDIFTTYVLEPMGIHYTHAEGSLPKGFTLHNVRTDESEAKTLSLHYDLLSMMEGKQTIDSITIDGLRLYLDDFMDEDGGLWPFPTFHLANVTITNLQLIGEYPIELDIHAKNGTYDGDHLSFDSLRASVKSRYAGGALSGTVKNNTFSGLADLYPNHTELAPYVSDYTTLPRALRVDVAELSPTQVRLRSLIDTLESKQDPLLSARSIALDFRYRYENDYFESDAFYTLVRGEDAMQTSHRLRHHLDGTTRGEFIGEITSSRPLPATLLEGNFIHTPEMLSGSLTLDGSTLKFSTDDYEHYLWNLQSHHQNLSFVPDLPDMLKASPFTLVGEGSYTQSADRIEGKLRSWHDHARFEGLFSLDTHRTKVEGNVTLPAEGSLWKNSSIKPPERLTLSLHGENNVSTLQLSGESLALHATLQNDRLKGSGNYAGAFFDLSGTLNEGEKNLRIDTLIPSLFTTLSKLRPMELHKGEYYDAEIRAQTRIDFTDTLTLDTRINVPWYAAILDTRRAYSGVEGFADLSYREGNITIKRYRFDIADRPISTDKSSHLHIDESGSLILDEVWIFDALKLQGTLHSDLSASLRLHSERFTYTGPEGSAHAAADIRFERNARGEQNLFGNLNILDALITYLPLQELKVMDDDIIIIQDIRPPSSSALAINLRVDADKPIRFKTKELDFYVHPDFTLWKEPLGPLQILGMVRIPSGIAMSAGKLFDIQPSEIYFGGDVPLNPYLNLTVEHEVDYKKILIYITHTLESPIFLFSSDPIMSQNDIMSYLLFGGPANTASGGDNSTTTVRADATNFMLGAGLKGLISGATKVKIDTMNILTTAEGGMGFEVGARLNKDLRVLYKNDTVSSVLIQYSINRWLRLDADIHELGQGINAIYVKDFRDFLPHNKPPKK